MSTQSLEAGLSTLVNQFKQDVNVHVANYLSATLGAATATAARTNGKSNGAKANGHAVKAAVASDRAKGEKRSQEELDAMQKRFVDFVSKNPGLRIEQINKQLGDTTTKDLQLPIRKAIADGLIKTKGEKRSTQYFAR